jgi:hypothetical protein
MALQLWTAMQLEKIIDRVDITKVKTLENYVALVTAFQLEFEAKTFNLETLRALSDTFPDDVDQSKLQELVEELSLDLQCYCNDLQQQVSGMSI